MAVAYEGVQSRFSAVGGLDPISTPAGVGSLLIAHLAWNDPTLALDSAYTTGAGWVIAGEVTGSNRRQLILLKDVSGGAAASYGFTLPPAPRAHGAISRWSGADPSALSGASLAASISATPVGGTAILAPAPDGSHLCIFHMNYGGGVAWTKPSGWTDRYNFGDATGPDIAMASLGPRTAGSSSGSPAYALSASRAWANQMSYIKLAPLVTGRRTAKMQGMMS